MDIISNIPAAFWDEAVDMANAANSITPILMDYDPAFGENIKIFFEWVVRFMEEAA